MLTKYLIMGILKTILVLLCFIFSSCNEGKKDTEDTKMNEQAKVTEKAENMRQSMLKTNKDLFKAWNDKDKNLMSSHLAEDFVRYANGKKEFTGRDQYLAMMDSLNTAFPGFEIIDKGNTRAFGNKTYGAFVFSGTNEGNFMGNPPTGKKADVEGYAIWTFNDEGKAISEEVYFDRLDWITQLGYETSPPKK